jgi:hypothetical protein
MVARIQDVPDPFEVSAAYTFVRDKSIEAPLQRWNKLLKSVSSAGKVIALVLCSDNSRETLEPFSLPPSALFVNNSCPGNPLFHQWTAGPPCKFTIRADAVADRYIGCGGQG